MTYSIVARDDATGALGVAVQTHQPAVGAVVPWVKGGVGAIATQSFANVHFGPRGLALLESGLDASAALRALLAADDLPHLRQVAVLDAEGRVAVHTGNACIPFAGHVTGEGFACQANMMTNPGVPEAMAAAYLAAGGTFPERLLTALDAAEAAGGDIRGRQSAALLIQPAREFDYHWNFRVDDSSEPLRDLRRLLAIRLANTLLPPPGSATDLPEALAALERALALAPSDETLFWFAVRTLAPAGHTAAAADLLRPLFERAPRWRALLDRLHGPGYEPLEQLRTILDPSP